MSLESISRELYSSQTARGFIPCRHCTSLNWVEGKTFHLYCRLDRGSCSFICIVVDHCVSYYIAAWRELPAGTNEESRDGETFPGRLPHAGDFCGVHSFPPLQGNSFRPPSSTITAISLSNALSMPPSTVKKRTRLITGW